MKYVQKSRSYVFYCSSCPTKKEYLRRLDLSYKHEQKKKVKVSIGLMGSFDNVASCSYAYVTYWSCNKDVDSVPISDSVLIIIPHALHVNLCSFVAIMPAHLSLTNPC